MACTGILHMMHSITTLLDADTDDRNDKLEEELEEELEAAGDTDVEDGGRRSAHTEVG